MSRPPHSDVDALQRYQDRKQRLVGWMRALALTDPARACRASSLADGPTISEYADRLAGLIDQDVFRVGVIGEFSSGKSSLLNVLLRILQPEEKRVEGMLPTDITATTAAVTELFYSELPCAEAVLKGGAVLHPPLDELPLFLTEPKLLAKKFPILARGHKLPNPKDIEKVLVGLPCPLLSLGVRILDTPGLGSVHADHGRIARDCVAGVDAAVFLVSVNPAMGEREMTFLQYVLGFTDRLLFVQTKRDQGDLVEAGEEVWKRRQRWHQERIQEILGSTDVEIHVVSALQAARGLKRDDSEALHLSGIPKFEQALQQFLADVRGASRLAVWVRKARRMLALADLTLRSREERFNARLGASATQAATQADYKQWEDVERGLRVFVDKLRRESDHDLKHHADGIARKVWAATDHALSGLSPKSLRDDGNQRFQLERTIVRSIQRESASKLEGEVDEYGKKLARCIEQALGDRVPEAMRQYQVSVDPRRLLDDVEVSLLADQFIKSETKVVVLQPSGLIEAIGDFFRRVFGQSPRTKEEEEYSIDRGHVQTVVEHTVRTTVDDLAIVFRKHVDRVEESAIDEMRRIVRAAKEAEEHAARISQNSIEECRKELEEVTGQRATIRALELELDEIEAVD